MNKLSKQDFKLCNIDGKCDIFITDDTNLNKLTLTFTNNTGSTLEFLQGSPSAQTGVGASSFYFDFGDLLDTWILKLIVLVVPEGWLATYIDGKFPCWAVVPKKDCLLNPNEQMQFCFTNIICKNSAPGYFNISYCNIPDIYDSEIPFSYSVAVIRPPVSTPKYLNLNIGYKDVQCLVNSSLISQKHSFGIATDTPISAYITYNVAHPLRNQFTLYLSNPSKDTDIPQDPNGRTTFYLSFVYGDTAGDLTTKELAAQMKVNIRKEYGTVWEVPTKPIGQLPVWPLYPKSPVVLGVGNQASIEFSITDIVTMLPEGLTTLYIQYNYVPGYDDGVFTLMLNKCTAKPKITSFISDKSRIDLGDSVNISWETQLADVVILEYSKRDGSIVHLSSENGDISINQSKLTVTPDKPDTTFTLKAEADTLKLWDVFPGLYVQVNQPDPIIKSFKVSPTIINISSGNPQTVTLSWEAANAQSYMLLPKPGPTLDTSFITSTPETQDYYLTAYPYGTPGRQATTSACVYACKNYVSVITSYGQNCQYLPVVRANQSLPYIYACDAGLKKILFYDYELRNQVKQLDGTNFALSPDGNNLYYILGSSPNLIMQLDIMSLKIISKFMLQVCTPCSLFVSQDNSMVYVLGKNNSMQIIYKSNQNTSRLITFPDSSQNPSAICEDNNCIYVACYSSRQFFIIDKINYNITNTLTLSCSECTDMVYNPINKLIYIAAQSSNAICTVDTVSLKTDYITVGDRPCSLKLSKDGIYLYVTNFNTNYISIVDLRNNSVQNITVGSSPCALKCNSNYSLLYVANYLGQSVSVLDISQGFPTLIATIPIPNCTSNPYDIDVKSYPEGWDYVYVGTEGFSPRIIHNPVSDSCAIQVAVIPFQRRII